MINLDLSKDQKRKCFQIKHDLKGINLIEKCLISFSLIKEILQKENYLSLATVDDKGVWVVDIFYINIDLNIYWLSQPAARHSSAIKSNPHVAGTITLTQKPGEPDLGLQIEGNAERREGDNLQLATKHRLKRNKPAPLKEGEIFEHG